MKTKISPTQQAKARLEKLVHYDYLVHRAVFPRNRGPRSQPTEAGKRHYQRVDERTKALTNRILAKLDDVCDTQVSWCPEYHDTHSVASIVAKGAEAIEEYMSVPVEARGWGPLPVYEDSEGDQGWIYCPKDLAEQVARRIRLLDVGTEPEIEDYVAIHGVAKPPVSLGVRCGYELCQLARKGVTPPLIRFPEGALPAQRISDEAALDKIASLILHVSYSADRLLGKIEEVVLSTGRTA